jgi:hypothetical protein
VSKRREEGIAKYSRNMCSCALGSSEIGYGDFRVYRDKMGWVSLGLVGWRKCTLRWVFFMLH